MDKKSNRRKIGTYILFAAVTIFVVAVVLSLGDIGEVMNTIMTADFRYILAAVGALLVYLALYPLSLCILTRANGEKIGFFKTYSIAMTEHFFNGITPFATGGQPFQVYAFKRERVTIASSTSLLLMNFFVFMLVTNAFAACSLVYFRRFVTDGAMTAIAIIGFSMNFIVLAFTLLIALNKTARRLVSALVSRLAVWRLTRRLVAPRVDDINEYFDNVQSAFRALIKKKGAFFLSLLTKTLAMGAYYCVTFFILHALYVDVPASELFYIISGTSFAITMVVFLPTPGSSGGIEFAFRSVFASIVAAYAVGGSSIDTIATGGMLIWRVLTYYLAMLISLGFYVFIEIAYQRRAKRELLSPDGNGN
ncbi:MAG: flippase-like domain-containing protein [Clostridia bacterium]|nr:flippase-like domain-containing protein [Clostridia bacterium]